MKRTVALCVLMVLFASAGIAGQPATAATVPEDAVLLVELGNAVSLGAKTAALLRQVRPDAPVPELHQELARGALHTDEPDAIDFTKAFQIVRLAPPLDQAPVLVFSVKETQRYLDSLLMEAKDAQEGLRVYDDFGRKVFLAMVGTRTAMGANAEAVAKVADLVRRGDLSGEPLLGGDAAAFFRPKLYLEGLQKTGRDPFARIRDEFQRQPAGVPAAARAVSLQVLQAELDAVESLAHQADALVGTLYLSADEVSAGLTIRAAAGGGLAQYLATVPAGELDLLKHMPANCIGGACLKLGDMGPLAKWWMSAFGSFNVQPQEGALPQEFRDWIAKAFSNTGDQMAFSVLRAAQQGMCAVQVMRVKDPEAMKAFIKETPAKVAEMLKAYEAVGVKVALEAAPEPIIHNGHEIAEWSIRMEFQPPGPAGAQAGAVTDALVRAMWGDMPLKTYQAFTGDLYLRTQGPGALDAMKQLLDGTVQNIPASGKLDAPLARMPGAALVAYLDLGEAAAFALGTVSRVAPMLPRQLAQAKFQPAPPITLTARVAEERTLEARLVIPVAAVLTVVKGVQEAFMGAMTAPPGAM